MGERFFPFDRTDPLVAQDGSEATELDWRDMARGWLYSGVRLGPMRDSGLDTLRVSPASGLYVAIETGEAWIDGHYYRITPIGMGGIYRSLSVADPALTRLDRIVLRRDRGANTVSCVAKTGTPGGAAPGLVQTSSQWEISLATITVAPGATSLTEADILDERPIATGIDGSSGNAVLLSIRDDTTGLTFSQIPQSFSALRLEIIARATSAAHTQELRMNFNSDTAQRYHYGLRTSTSAGVVFVDRTGQTASLLSWIPGTYGVWAGQFAHGTVDITGYSAITRRTAWRASSFLPAGSVGGQWPEMHETSGEYAMYDRVTSIQVYPLADALASGTEARLYGIR